MVPRRGERQRQRSRRIEYGRARVSVFVHAVRTTANVVPAEAAQRREKRERDGSRKRIQSQWHSFVVVRTPEMTADVVGLGPHWIPQTTHAACNMDFG